MSATQLACPTCGADLATARPSPDGTTLHCPKCHGRFVAPPAPAPVRPGGGPSTVWVLAGGGAVLLLISALVVGVVLAVVGMTSPPRAPEKQGRAGAPAPPPAPGPTGDATPAGGQDPKDDPTVLIDGKPPLTQGMMDRQARVVESVLDLPLTEQQRSRWQQLWIEAFKKKDADHQARCLAGLQETRKWWEDASELSGGERGLTLAQAGTSFLKTIHDSTDPDDQMLAELYDAAHKPGGDRNAILVDSDPPLTQERLDHWRLLWAEYLLDIPLTAQQRQDFQPLFVAAWKKGNPKAEAEKLNKTWDNLMRFNRCQSHWLRAATRPGWVEGLRNDKNPDDLERWLLAAYELAHKPGGERNPILVDGDPPLTHDDLQQYGEQVEGALDLSVLNGLAPDQRQHLQDLVVGDWKGMDKAAREAFLREVWKAPDKASILAQVKKAAPGDERGLFLLKLFNQEQEAYNLLLHAEMARHDTEMRAIKAMGAGRLELNPDTGQLEWKP